MHRFIVAAKRSIAFPGSDTKPSSCPGTTPCASTEPNPDAYTYTDSAPNVRDRAASGAAAIGSSNDVL